MCMIRTVSNLAAEVTMHFILNVFIFAIFFLSLETCKTLLSDLFKLLDKTSILHIHICMYSVQNLHFIHNSHKSPPPEFGRHLANELNADSVASLVCTPFPASCPPFLKGATRTYLIKCIFILKAESLF